MKNVWNCLLVVLVNCCCIFAQEQAIDEASYVERMRKAGEYRLKENHRVRTITESCRGDHCTWKPISTGVTEYDNPGKMRSFTIQTDLGRTEPSTEFRFIDNKVYAKRPNMSWQIEEPRTPSDSIDQASEITKVEYKGLGIESNGLDEMRVLLKTNHIRQTLNGEGSESIQTIKSWIDRNGRLKKQEYVLTNSKMGATRLTKYYEVDPTIKIEVPIK